jgi:hypothetical protein
LNVPAWQLEHADDDEAEEDAGDDPRLHRRG